MKKALQPFEFVPRVVPVVLEQIRVSIPHPLPIGKIKRFHRNRVAHFRGDFEVIKCVIILISAIYEYIYIHTYYITILEYSYRTVNERFLTVNGM